MNKARRGKLLIFLSAAILTAASVVAAGVFSGMKQETKQETKRKKAVPLQAELVTTLPAVVSKVKDLEVEGVAIVRQRTPEAAIAITIRNNSPFAVMALDISSGDRNDFSSLGLDGLADPDDPQVVIGPYNTKTIEWRLDAILEGYDVVISAASFSNGFEDGEPRELEMMHRDREASKAKRDASKKGVPR
jgi:hypothetical protein